MSKYARFSIGAAVAVIAAGTFFATTNKIGPVSWNLWGPINEEAGVALKGYDPVVYLTEGAARRGSAENSLRWADVEWRFSSSENMDLFASGPETYAPQYGGFCATAVASGFTADIDPEVWQVEAGKLYNFNNQGAKDSWVAELGQDLILRGNENWEFR